MVTQDRIRLTGLLRRGPRRRGSLYLFARGQLGLVALLFGLAAIGWWWAIGRLQGMDEGSWTALGTFGWFIGVWIVMMAAMMLPSVAPMVALHARMTEGRSRVASAPVSAGRAPLR